MEPLLTQPRWRAEDLGCPLPASPHAVSVAMPLWSHVCAYEENDSAVVEKLQCGYPRFKLHPAVEDLFERYRRRYGRSGEQCFVFPSVRTAERCAAFMQHHGVRGQRIESLERNAAALLSSPSPLPKAYWQHTGEIISSRQALRMLGNVAPRHR